MTSWTRPSGACSQPAAAAQQQQRGGGVFASGSRRFGTEGVGLGRCLSGAPAWGRACRVHAGPEEAPASPPRRRRPHAGNRSSMHAGGGGGRRPMHAGVPELPPPPSQRVQREAPNEQTHADASIPSTSGRQEGAASGKPLHGRTTRGAGRAESPRTGSHRPSTASRPSTGSGDAPTPRAPGRQGAAARAGGLQPPPGELGCRHFGSCSGCALDQGLLRPAQYLEALEVFGARGFPNLQLVSGPLHGWRCRAKLAVRGVVGAPQVGLFRQASHEVVDIVPGCEIHHPRINEAAALIKDLMRKLKLPPYNEVKKTGLIRYLQLTVVGDQAAAQPRAELDLRASVQVVLVVNADSSSAPAFAAVRKLAAALWQGGGGGGGGSALVHSVWAHLHPSSSNAIIGRGEWSCMHGEEETWQTFGETPICLGPGSFVQANYGAFQSALASISSFVPPGSRVLELHAGVGAIGLSLFSPTPGSSTAPHTGTGSPPIDTTGPTSLRCVEINPAAEAPFQRSRERLLRDCFRSGAAAPSIQYLVAAAGDSPRELLAGADVVIMDPPRKGLEPALLEALCWDGEGDGGAAAATAPLPRTLIYLSCGWGALRQELDALGRHYDLVHACAYLFFPGTHAIETLCVFRRKVADHEASAASRA